MKFIETTIKGVLKIRPRVFKDDRGHFFESFQEVRYRQVGIDTSFVQDNVSRSSRGVLRGLHFQTENAQGKLVQVIRGNIFDVAVDIRPNSPTFGKWFGCELNDENLEQLYIPPGCAHGFYALGEFNDVLYKCTDVYNPTHEHTLMWNDPTVAIDWPCDEPPVLSPKDANGRTLDTLKEVLTGFVC
ncbi:MAG: dTDP-4-dehydrorhamnose 3,5-epimerase [Planctomycetota bacterium]